MKKKVLVFSHEFPPQQGGAGTYAYELASGLNKLNYNVEVLAGTTLSKDSNSKAVDIKLKEKGIDIQRYDWVKKNRLWFLSWKKIFSRHLKERGPYDYVFFANFTSCVIGHKLSSEALPPYSITLHGDDIDYYFTTKKLKSLILINKFKIIDFFKNSKKVICVSNFTKKKLLKVVPFNISCEVVHHGIEPKDLDLIRKSALALKKTMKQKIPKGKVILVYVSRLEPMKGQEQLIKLLSRNKKLAKKTHTIFIGGGSQYKFLNKLAEESNISDQVTFTGEIPRDEVLKFISIADILIFLSYHPRETFGLVILEGMLVKKPVIVRNHGGMIEAIEHKKNGYIIDDNNLESRLTALVNDRDLRKQMGDEGRKLIDQKFNSLNMVKKTIENQIELCAE